MKRLTSILLLFLIILQPTLPVVAEDSTEGIRGIIQTEQGAPLSGELTILNWNTGELQNLSVHDDGLFFTSWNTISSEQNEMIFIQFQDGDSIKNVIYILSDPSKMIDLIFEIAADEYSYGRASWRNLGPSITEYEVSDWVFSENERYISVLRNIQSNSNSVTFSQEYSWDDSWDIECGYQIVVDVVLTFSAGYLTDMTGIIENPNPVMDSYIRTDKYCGDGIEDQPYQTDPRMSIVVKKGISQSTTLELRSELTLKWQYAKFEEDGGDGKWDVVNNGELSASAPPEDCTAAGDCRKQVLISWV